MHVCEEEVEGGVMHALQSTVISGERPWSLATYISIILNIKTTENRGCTPTTGFELSSEAQ